MNSQAALVEKNLPASAGATRDTGLIPGSGRSPGGGHSNPLQDSCLENPTDRGAWRVTVRGVTRSRTRLKRLSAHVLAAQWVGLHASPVWSLVRELGSHTACGSARNKHQKEIDLGRGQSRRWGLCAGHRVREVELWGEEMDLGGLHVTPVTESAQSRPAVRTQAGLLKTAPQQETRAPSGRCQQARPRPSWPEECARKTDLRLLKPEQDDLGLPSPCTVVISEGGNVIFELHTSHKIMWTHADNDASPRACQTVPWTPVFNFFFFFLVTVSVLLTLRKS